MPATCCTFSLIVGCHYISSFLWRLPHRINPDCLIDSPSINRQDIILEFWVTSIKLFMFLAQVSCTPRSPAASWTYCHVSQWSLGDSMGVAGFISCLLQLLSYLTPTSLPGDTQKLRSPGLSQLSGSLHLSPSYSISIVSFHGPSWKSVLFSKVFILSRNNLVKYSQVKRKWILNWFISLAAFVFSLYICLHCFRPILAPNHNAMCLFGWVLSCKSPSTWVSSDSKSHPLQLSQSLLACMFSPYWKLICYTHHMHIVYFARLERRQGCDSVF